MTAAWEHVLQDLDDAARAVERAADHPDLHMPIVALPHDLGVLPPSMASRASAVLARMRRAEVLLELACERARRALVITDASAPGNAPHFIDTHS